MQSDKQKKKSIQHYSFNKIWAISLIQVHCKFITALIISKEQEITKIFHTYPIKDNFWEHLGIIQSLDTCTVRCTLFCKPTSNINSSTSIHSHQGVNYVAYVTSTNCSILWIFEIPPNTINLFNIIIITDFMTIISFTMLTIIKTERKHPSKNHRKW